MADIIDASKKSKAPIEFWVNRVIETRTNPDGTKTALTKWEKRNEPINLGSVSNPQNIDIIGFKWVERDNGMGRIIGSFLGGFD